MVSELPGLDRNPAVVLDWLAFGAGGRGGDAIRKLLLPLLYLACATCF